MTETDPIGDGRNLRREQFDALSIELRKAARRTTPLHVHDANGEPSPIGVHITARILFATTLADILKRG